MCINMEGVINTSEEAVLFIFFLAPSSFEAKLGYKKTGYVPELGFLKFKFNKQKRKLSVNSKVESG